MITHDIGGRRIGDGQPCFVIAEAGANHNRDLGMARELIAVAADAGADAVKFQTYSAETLYSKKTPRFAYLEPLTDNSTWQLIKDIELPRNWQAELAAEAATRGILFMSTPFDHAAVDDLAALVPAFKIASFEIVDLDLIRHAASLGKPIIISTGLADYEDIADALAACRQVGNEAIVLLQCASLYPAPPERMNLRAMETMRRAFGTGSRRSSNMDGRLFGTADVLALLDREPALREINRHREDGAIVRGIRSATYHRLLGEREQAHARPA